MNTLVPSLLSDNTLRVRHQNTLEFRLMQTIYDNSTNMGSILGCSLVGIISQGAAASVSGLRGNNYNYIRQLHKQHLKSYII